MPFQLWLDPGSPNFQPSHLGIFKLFRRKSSLSNKVFHILSFQNNMTFNYFGMNIFISLCMDSFFFFVFLNKESDLKGKMFRAVRITLLEQNMDLEIFTLM